MNKTHQKNQELTQIRNVLKKGLFCIDPVIQTVSRDLFSLAYTPGVGMTCQNIY